MSRLPNTDPGFPPRLDVPPPDPKPPADERPARATDRLYVELSTGLFRPPATIDVPSEKALPETRPRGDRDEDHDAGRDDDTLPPAPRHDRAAFMTPGRRLAGVALGALLACAALAWLLDWSSPSPSPPLPAPSTRAVPSLDVPPPEPVVAPAPPATGPVEPEALPPLTVTGSAKAPHADEPPPAKAASAEPAASASPARARTPKSAIDDDELRRAIVH